MQLNINAFWSFGKVALLISNSFSNSRNSNNFTRSLWWIQYFLSSFSNDVYDGKCVGNDDFDDDDAEEEEEEHIYRRLEDMVSEDHYREFYYQVLQHFSRNFIEGFTYLSYKVLIELCDLRIRY